MKILAMFVNGIWNLRSIMLCSVLLTWRYHCICYCKMNKSIKKLKFPLLIVLSWHFFIALKFNSHGAYMVNFSFYLSTSIFHLYLEINNYLVHTFRNSTLILFFEAKYNISSANYHSSFKFLGKSLFQKDSSDF